MAAATKILAVVRAVIATRTVVDGRFRPCRVALAEVVEASGCPRRPVLRVLERLVREGWLALASDERVPAGQMGEVYGPKRRNPTYDVVRDFRLHRAHQARGRVTCRDKLWGTLRSVRRTTISNMTRLTGCAEDTCREYLLLLVAHGYVRQSGKDGREKIWALVRDAGARRPETTDHVDRGNA
ncbi:MAG: hypothetical protein GYA47_08505 [Desulfovibrio sp.]|nr:hypothetical protein [Desulfovibrio sp.]